MGLNPTGITLYTYIMGWIIKFKNIRYKRKDWREAYLLMEELKFKLGPKQKIKAYSESDPTQCYIIQTDDNK